MERTLPSGSENVAAARATLALYELTWRAWLSVVAREHLDAARKSIG